jgi:hypothetical protein
VSVTVSRCCEACGASLEGRRRQTRTCSAACRTRVWRRSRNCHARSVEGAPSRIADLRRAWFRLTFEEREEKRQEIDCLARERLESRDPEQTARDRALFDDDPGRANA